MTDRKASPEKQGTNEQATVNDKNGINDKKDDRKDTYEQYINYCQNIFTSSFFTKCLKFPCFNRVEQIDSAKLIQQIKLYKIYIDKKVPAKSIKESKQQNSTNKKENRLSQFKRTYENTENHDNIESKHQEKDEKLAQRLFIILEDFLQALNSENNEERITTRFSLCKLHSLFEAFDEIKKYKNGAQKRTNMILQQRIQNWQQQLKKKILTIPQSDNPPLYKQEKRFYYQDRQAKDKKENDSKITEKNQNKQNIESVEIKQQLSAHDSKENMSKVQIPFAKPNQYISEQIRLLCQLEEKLKNIEEMKSKQQQKISSQNGQTKKSSKSAIPNRFQRQQIKLRNQLILSLNQKKQKNKASIDNWLKVRKESSPLVKEQEISDAKVSGFFEAKDSSMTGEKEEEKKESQEITKTETL